MLTIIRLHLRRLLVLLLDGLFDHNGVYSLLGWLQSTIGRPKIQSVFLMYPETLEYALAFVYPSRLARVKWRPFLAGIFRQNRRWGLMFAISATPADFRNPENLVHLHEIVKRMEAIRRRVKARQKTFAGILPGVLFARRLIRQAPEAELTVLAVLQAIDQVTQKANLSSKTPILVLGGRGFIGRRLVKALQTNGRIVLPIEKAEPWPEIPCASPVLIVNVASNTALMEYLGHLRSGMIVINEAYPPPSPLMLRFTGITLYHIKGIRAWAFPPFPHAYRGGIPCCAAFPDEAMIVQVEKLLDGRSHPLRNSPLNASTREQPNTLDGR